MTAASRPELVGLRVADAPERWEALGFAVFGASLHLGRVTVELGAPGRGITAWSLSVPGPGADIDGLPTAWAVAPADARAPAHPNGATGLDHVVAVTTNFDRTAARLADAGLPLRRVRHGGPGNRRQGFRRLGPAIFEVVEVAARDPGDAPAPGPRDPPARFWGLTVIVADLDALARRLGDRLGPVHPAVQPGRHIATLRQSAGLSAAVAFMDAS